MNKFETIVTETRDDMIEVTQKTIPNVEARFISNAADQRMNRIIVMVSKASVPGHDRAALKEEVKDIITDIASLAILLSVFRED